MTIVTIVGAGMMGTAMCWPLADNGHTVRLVGTPLDEEIIASIRASRIQPRLQRAIPEGVEAFTVSELPQALEGARLVVGGVSSFGVDWLAEAVGPHLAAGVPVLSVTKGLEDQPDGTLLTLPEALERKLPARLRGRTSLNAIGGPCIAHELAACRQTAVVFTGKEASTLETLRGMLSTPYYHVWTSTDLAGVETCAAMKNAYAMGVCLAAGMMEQAGPDGLAHMYNAQAALFAQSCLEMRRLLKVVGGGEDNVSWLPGAGDLFVTIFGGRTRQLGMLLGQELPFAEARQSLAGVTLESVEIITRVARALPKLEARGLTRTEDFPLLLHMNAILNRGAHVDLPWEKFFN
jgi:glycerol-3-phosphate dehydrogenase (NAD(P)+)